MFDSELRDGGHPCAAGTSRGIPGRRPAGAASDDRTAAAWTGPCAGDPARWDLDAGNLTQWLTAMRVCVNCPVLDSCVALRDEFFPNAGSSHRAGNPSGVIWAGIAYSESGVPLDGRGLRLYAARRRASTEHPVTPERPAAAATAV
ncbi:MAG TPA: hypothetical protein VFC16_07080 [Nakamurella sp.]|nr:hypothetical protein [Nakamurella sp.]